MSSTVSSLANWIGVGTQFEGTFNKYTGGVNINTGTTRIEQSIWMILSTIKGERFFLPEFGSDLDKCLFEQNDEILKTRVRLEVNTALAKWEPRISVLSVEPITQENSNELPIVISYKVKGTNMVGNYVYPFKRSVMQLGDVS